jgi:hypothetical protein
MDSLPSSAFTPKDDQPGLAAASVAAEPEILIAPAEAEAEEEFGSAWKPPVKPASVGAGGGNGGLLHVAAVATHLERYMPLLVQSSARLGVHLEVLGWGEKLTGFAFRLQKTLDFVETLPPNDVVLFIDAFDVVLLQNANVILKKFYSSGAQMIVSKDGDHPNHIVNFFIKRVFRPVGDTHINIGGFIGYAGYVRDLMKALFKFGEGFSDRENDQELLARYLSQNKPLVGTEIIIDEHSDLFLTLYGGHPLWIGKNEYKLVDHRKDIEITKDGMIHHLPSDSWPCVVHFPSNGNADELLERLGYKLPSSVDKNYSQLSHTKYNIRMFRHYWPFIATIFAKIILAIIVLVVIGFLIYRWRNSPKPSATNGSSEFNEQLARRNIQFVPYQPIPPSAIELPRAYLVAASPPPTFVQMAAS